MSVVPETLEQRRAGHALGKVNELQSLEKDRYGNFVSYVESLPASIVINGLGQAMAYELSCKKDVGHEHLYNIMEDWLCHNSGAFTDSSNDLMEAITENGQREYVLAQAESLAYLEWLKKFARAYLEKGGNDE